MIMADNLPTVIMQTLTDSCPDMDWAAGSVARELVAVPAAMLGATFDKYVQDAERLFDINALRTSPELYKEQIDSWVEWLGLSTERSTRSSGKIKIYLSDLSETLVIMEGTQFSTESALLQASSITSWAAPATIGTDYTYATAYPDGTYAIEIDVTAVAPSAVTIAEGTVLNWDSAPSYVTGVFVASAINGGQVDMTYNEKAELIYDTLQPRTVTSSDNLQALLRIQYPHIVNSARIGRRTGDITSTANVYVKPVRSPQEIIYKLTADTKEGKSFTFNGCGIYAVKSVEADYAIVSDYTVTYSGAVGASDSRITITTNNAYTEITVVCTGFSDFNEIHSILNNTQTLSPCSFRLCMPTVAYVAVEIHTNDELTDEAQTALQHYINTLTLNADAVSDTDIRVVLEDYGITLTAPSFYTINVVHGEYKYTHTATGAVSLSQLSAGSDTPIACYSFLDSIGVF